MSHSNCTVRLLLNDRGVAATEYSLLSCLLCMVMLVGVNALGGDLNYYAFGQLSHGFGYGGGSTSTLPPPDGGGSSDVTGSRIKRNDASSEKLDDAKKRDSSTLQRISSQ